VQVRQVVFLPGTFMPYELVHVAGPVAYESAIHLLESAFYLPSIILHITGMHCRYYRYICHPVYPSKVFILLLLLLLTTSTHRRSPQKCLYLYSRAWYKVSQS